VGLLRIMDDDGGGGGEGPEGDGPSEGENDAHDNDGPGEYGGYDDGGPSRYDNPVGTSTFSLKDMSNLSRPDEVDRTSAIDSRWGSIGRFDEINRAPQDRLTTSAPADPRNATSIQDKGKTDSRDGAIATFGVSYSQLAATVVGVGIDIGENERPGSGLEGYVDAYAVVGPIIAVPLPINVPTFNIGLSPPSKITTGVDPVDCSAIGLLATPLFSVQAAFDPKSGEFKGATFSVTVAIQLGLAAGIYCGFGAH